MPMLQGKRRPLQGSIPSPTQGGLTDFKGARGEGDRAIRPVAVDSIFAACALVRAGTTVARGYESAIANDGRAGGQAGSGNEQRRAGGSSRGIRAQYAANDRVKRLRAVAVPDFRLEIRR